MKCLEVSEAIGEVGWRILAKSIRPWILGDIRVTLDGLAQGKREAIKNLFDAGCWFRIFKTFEDLQATNRRASLVFHSTIVEGPNDWRQMEQLLDMSKQEFGEEIERRRRRNGGVW